VGGLNPRHTFGWVFGLEARIAVVVFILIVATVGFALVRSRVRRGRPPSEKASHPKAETAYVAVVSALAVFLIVTSISANSSPPPTRPSLTVSVTAFQWCWRFSYPGTGVSLTGTCTAGHDPTLVLPVGRVVRVQLTSADVVHAMWIPYLRFKMEAFPNYVNSFETELHTTGSFPGRCSEFCGLYHYAMDFTLEAVTPARFAAWLHSQEQTR
jgi:cytochrome c oxidase subunit 2